MPSLLSEYGKKFEDWMVEMFYNYGLILGRHPFWFLWGPIIFTVCCTPGLFWLKINLDLYKLFVPLDAPVRYEHERSVVFDWTPLGDLSLQRIKNSSRIALPNQTRKPRDDGLAHIDMEMEKLRYDLQRLIADQRHLNATRRKRQVKLDPRKEEVVVKKSQTRKSEAPTKNDILRFYVVHKKFDNLLQSKYLGPLYDYTNKMMEVSMEFHGLRYSLDDFCYKDSTHTECDNTLNVWIKHADVLFKDGKVKTNPNLQLSYPVLYLFNRPKDIGNVIYGVDVKGEKNEIQGARVLTLHWLITYPGSSENNAAYYQYREALMDFWRKVMEETDFEFIPHNDKAMDDEMMKIIETTVPFAIPATIMLMFYVVFANWSSLRHQSKPLEMYLGVWSVILALICTFGIFFFLGIAFNPVTSTMPFLVLAVGIDDDFLMIAAWRELDRRIPVHQKIALVMADAGASITVTSFTNFFCFALGYYMCSTPAVAEFCLITAWAVLIDYLMQITFFAAVLCYSGRKEETGGLASCCYKNEELPQIESTRPSIGTPLEVEINCHHHAKTKNCKNKLFSVPYMHEFFGERFAPFILRKDVRVVSWIIFIAYTFITLYGCCKLKVDISPVKYIRDNSPIQTFVKLADKYIWADNVMPKFHVMNPPDLRDANKRARLNELVYRLEHTNYSIGRVSTNFWMWQYQQYLNDFPDVDYERDFYNKKYLRDFFNQIDYSQYRRELFRWRAILREYPDFDMFLAGIFSPFLIDQRHTIAPSSMQTIGSALAMMALISFFFLPDAQSVFLMTWSLLSISMGVCGGLAMLGSDLDSVSMGCIVMAIGLAVDYSVHVCYRYHRSEFTKASDKVRDTLCSVGWPITQAVTSTLFGLATTAFVPAYLVRVFFQTVYLVNLIGLTHALVWLPQLIAALDPCERVPLRLRLKKR
ncbi:patched family protein [Dictyocaulus viviparus]|uniref:Patched family protein n=1 Tax=Dictyocaulus viviparus TaxID=29172 RepID=A0A0D8XY85_DICVI|nr:patched family protein [Dictyocaulus viviparus]